jgi:hypothetical protein
MTTQDYHRSITLSVTPKQAMEKIGRVSEWWAKNYEGMSQKLGDEFTVRFGDTFVNFKITEVIPEKKVVWHVTDCNLHWINQKKEWNGTEVVFELTPEMGSTRIDFTHFGLVPGVECYKDCETGWDEHFKHSLFQYLTEGKGRPQ